MENLSIITNSNNLNCSNNIMDQPKQKREYKLKENKYRLVKYTASKNDEHKEIEFTKDFHSLNQIGKFLNISHDKALRIKNRIYDKKHSAHKNKIYQCYDIELINGQKHFICSFESSDNDN